MTVATSTAHKDPVQKVLGNFGKWQLRAMLIIFLCKMPTSWFMAILIFTALAPENGDVHCTPSKALPANHLAEWIAKAHPVKYDRHHHAKIDYCHVYDEYLKAPMDYIGHNLTTAETANLTLVKCTNFTFDPNFHSIAAGFNLICDRQLLVSLSQCFHILGLLLGGITAYVMMKYMSPKTVMIIGISAQIIFGNLTGLARIYEIHIILKCLTAASCALMYTAGSAIFGDITSGAAKVIATLVFEFFWSVGLIVLPLFSLFIEEWWRMYIGISMPTILLIFLIKYLPDSPRWLLRNGHLAAAKEILVEGGHKNKRRIPIDLDDMLKNEYESGAANPKEATWCEIWDGKPSKVYIFAVHYAWSVYILLFNCIILNIVAYGREHLSINTVSLGFSEILGVFIGIYLVLYTSRRWLWAGLIAIFCGVLGYFTWFIPTTLHKYHVVALEMAPTLAIKIASSVGMCVLTACTAELVAADRKKMLMFSSTVWARAWFLWAPFVNVLKSFDVILPLTVFATLSVIGGLIMVVIHQNQYKTYLKDCEQRIQNMRTMRSLSNAGLDWIKSARRKSVYNSDDIRKNSVYNIEEARRKSLLEHLKPRSSLV